MSKADAQGGRVQTIEHLTQAVVTREATDLIDRTQVMILGLRHRAELKQGGYPERVDGKGSFECVEQRVAGVEGSPIIQGAEKGDDNLVVEMIKTELSAELSRIVAFHSQK